VILSDGGIIERLDNGKLDIDPLDRQLIQPSSIDVRLGFDFIIFNTHTTSRIDPTEDNSKLGQQVALTTTSDEFVLHPGEFALGTTHERFAFPADLVGQVNGKSSLGRLGLMIHATAGFIDPGFCGVITLELSNVAKLPIPLRPMMLIAQISFLQMDAPALRPYGSPGLASKYQNQGTVVASRYNLNYPS
jgi:dCTP deaminase